MQPDFFAPTLPRFPAALLACRSATAFTGFPDWFISLRLVRFHWHPVNRFISFD